MTTTPAPAWNDDLDLAYRTLAEAWLLTDDLRRDHTATLEVRHDAFVALDEARRTLRQLRTPASRLLAA